jgi:hypothetical protein
VPGIQYRSDTQSIKKATATTLSALNHLLTSLFDGLTVNLYQVVSSACQLRETDISARTTRNPRPECSSASMCLVEQPATGKALKSKRSTYPISGRACNVEIPSTTSRSSCDIVRLPTFLDSCRPSFRRSQRNSRDYTATASHATTTNKESAEDPLRLPVVVLTQPDRPCSAAMSSEYQPLQPADDGGQSPRSRHCSFESTPADNQKFATALSSKLSSLCNEAKTSTSHDPAYRKSITSVKSCNLSRTKTAPQFHTDFNVIASAYRNDILTRKEPRNHDADNMRYALRHGDIRI